MRLTISDYMMFISVVAFVAQSKPQSTPDKTANAVLQKLSDNLRGHKRISYEYSLSINYFSESFHSNSSGRIYLDFENGDTTLGFRYQSENEQSKFVYNGSQNFSLNKKDNTIKIIYQPKLRDFASRSFFLNSVVTLKNILPAIIADNSIEKTLSDTAIGDQRFYLVSLTLQNKTLSSLGTFDTTTIKRTFFYRIVIDKSNFLPLHIIQKNDAQPKDYQLTSFAGIKLNPAQPSEFSWYYSTYLTEYKPVSEKQLILVRPNTSAPGWTLNYFNNSDSVGLSKLKGKVVLLEFWEKNCGYCVAAVPKLNAIVGKYNGKNLQLIGINAHDAKKDMNNFYKKNQPKFKTVYDTLGKVTRDYGVDAFPTMVLINKKGIIVYAGSLSVNQIDSLLKITLE